MTSTHRAIVPALVACALSTLTAARGQAPGTLPAWEPTPALVKGLDPEFTLNGWTIRPPRGHERATKKDAKETRTTWAKQDANGVSGLIVVEILVTPTVPLEEGIINYVNLLKTRAKNLTPGRPERGTVGGRPFIRCRFSAESILNVERPAYGFAYLTYEGPKPYAVVGFATKESIEQLEAAAQTFHAGR